MDILIYGTVNSVTFALIAVGFTLVYGVARVPNFAHDSIYVLVGFLTYTFIHDLGIPYPVAVLLSLLIAAAMMLGIQLNRATMIRAL